MVSSQVGWSRTISALCRLRCLVVTEQSARSRAAVLLPSLFPRAGQVRYLGTRRRSRQGKGIAADVGEAGAAAAQARRRFGDTLPDGELSEAAYKIYVRRYGKPLRLQEDDRIDNNDVDQIDATTEVQLLKEVAVGQLGEVELDDVEDVEDAEDVPDAEDVDDVDEGKEARQGPTNADAQLARDIESALSSTDPDQEVQALPSGEQGEDNRSSHERVHPLTLAGRFSTSPSTLPLPRATLVEPIAALLSSSTPVHLKEAALRIFGGKGLPYSTSTPSFAKTMQQKPIPLTAAQTRMTDIEGDVFLACLYPGIYATVMSVLVETRKRLGTAWAESLVKKAQIGHLRVLDAGGGGAGVLAVRELLRVEWERMHEANDETHIGSGMALAEADGKIGGAALTPPLGHATVLAGSDALRYRASKLLENTTFVPRLPDYVHSTSKGSDSSEGKFDIVIAPHTLWPLREDWMRKGFVQNLWQLLKKGDKLDTEKSPVEKGAEEGGGVLFVLEKGVPRGFELVATARDMLLETFIKTSSKSGTSVLSGAEAEIQWEDAPGSSEQQEDIYGGMIVAPCTTHAACPMYIPKTHVKGRREICHFEQRFVRPHFLQKIRKSFAKNFEDIKLSYLSVRRGPYRQDSHPMTFQNPEATARAFEGFEHNPPAEFSHNLLPRNILTPLKKQGHVIMDLCTSAGSLERWTVTKSFSRLAFRDARKSAWGDLWAMGAKTRIKRSVRAVKKREHQEAELEAVNGEIGGKGKRKRKKRERRVDEAKVDYDDFGRIIIVGGREESAEK